MKHISIVGYFLALAWINPAWAVTPQYQGMELYPLALPPNLSPRLNDIRSPAPAFGGTYVDTGSASGSSHAVVWIGPAGSPVDLNPSHLSGFTLSGAYGTSGIQQVGAAANSQISHAILWNGSAQSAVDLHPTHLPQVSASQALSTNGSQQVGVFTLDAANGFASHAALWNGTAASAIDLNPATVFESTAIGISPDGAQQVGSGSSQLTAGASHAFVWNGTAQSAVDLHPSQFVLGSTSSSAANGTSGGEQVGYFNDGVSPDSHAIVWHGNAASAIDLNSQTLGVTAAQAFGTNGTLQVGVGSGFFTGFQSHALLWAGTAASVIDLHVLLPNQFRSSVAYTIDSGGIVYGTAVDLTGQTHAVQWVQVPEPSCFVLVLTGATIPALAWLLSSRQFPRTPFDHTGRALRN
jgi:hypothetical protein